MIIYSLDWANNGQVRLKWHMGTPENRNLPEAGMSLQFFLHYYLLLLAYIAINNQCTFSILSRFCQFSAQTNFFTKMNWSLADLDSCFDRFEISSTRPSQEFNEMSLLSSCFYAYLNCDDAFKGCANSFQIYGLTRSNVYPPKKGIDWKNALVSRSANVPGYERA